MKLIRTHLLMLPMLLVSGWALAQTAPTTGATPAERIGLTLVNNRSTYTTAGERNNYMNSLQLNQPSGDYKLTAGMLNEGDNHIIFHRFDNQGNDTEFARVNLNAVVTESEAELLDYLNFYGDGNNKPSTNTTITANDLSGTNWGTNGSNLIWQTSGYAYISGSGGLTFTVPAGYNNATLQFYIVVGSNARGGYFAYNLNGEGWYIATSASANYSTDFVINSVNSGDVISLYGVNNTQSSLAASPDIALIAAFILPDSYMPTIEVTPTVCYWDGENWGDATPLGTNATYTPNDTVNLYGLGTVTDSFYAETDENAHSDYYDYNITFDGNITLPSNGATGLDFYASVDFAAGGTVTGDNNWALNETNLYYIDDNNHIAAIIFSYGDINYTMPNSFMGNQVNVTVTSCPGTYGAGDVYVNGVLHTFTAEETYTWTVNVAANGFIELRTSESSELIGISSIVISSGNGASLNAPGHDSLKSSKNMPVGFNHKADELKRFTGCPKERIINVTPNDK